MDRAFTCEIQPGYQGGSQEASAVAIRVRPHDRGVATLRIQGRRRPDGPARLKVASENPEAVKRARRGVGCPCPAGLRAQIGHRPDVAPARHDSQTRARGASRRSARPAIRSTAPTSHGVLQRQGAIHGGCHVPLASRTGPDCAATPPPRRSPTHRLGHAAAVLDVRHDDRHRPLIQEAVEELDAVPALATGNRQGRRAGDRGQVGGRRCRLHRLLEPAHVERRELARDGGRRLRREAAVTIDQQARVGADRAAYRPHSLQAGKGLTEHAVHGRRRTTPRRTART